MKKVMLMVVAAVLLIGVQAFTEEEREDRPREGERQREVIRDQPRVRVRAEQGRAEFEGQREPEQVRRREAVREGEQEMEVREFQREPQVRTGRRLAVQDREIRPEISPPMLDEPRPIGPWLDRPPIKAFRDRPVAGPMFGRCLDELTKAYEEKDWERMGQVIRRMHQVRQRMQASGPVGLGRGWRGGAGPAPGRGIRGRGWGGWQPDVEEPQPPLGEFRPPVEREPRDFQPEELDRPRLPVLPRGPEGRGRGEMPEGMSRRRPVMPPPDVEEPRPVVPREEELR